MVSSIGSTASEPAPSERPSECSNSSKRIGRSGLAILLGPGDRASFSPRQDLLPSNRQYADLRLPAKLRVPVVWLTTSAETTPTADPHIFTLLLTVRVSSISKKLVPYRKWLGRLESGVASKPFYEKARGQWWAYRGVIPRRWIVDADLIMGREPWWHGFGSGSATLRVQLDFRFPAGP